MKIQLEYLMNSDGRQFLNYWDYLTGRDVTCDVVDGVLLIEELDEHGVELPKREITIGEFLNKIRNNYVTAFNETIL